MRSNRLQLNSDKTEVMWCTTDRRQHQLPTAALPIDGMPVDPVSSVRDLGIYIDADLVMRTNVKKTASRCFAILRQLRQIHRYVSTDTFQALVWPGWPHPLSVARARRVCYWSTPRRDACSHAFESSRSIAFVVLRRVEF